MKDLKKTNTIAMFILAGLITTGFFCLLFMLFFVNIPTENKGMLDTAVGALIGAFSGGVVGYFFGSSAGSAEKTQLMNAVSQSQESTPNIVNLTTPQHKVYKSEDEINADLASGVLTQEQANFELDKLRLNG